MGRTGMVRMGSLLTVSLGMFLLGQTEGPANAVPYGDLMASGGALGILGWAVFYTLTRLVPADRAQNAATLASLQSQYTATLDKMAERHERWEAIRHSDSEALRTALVDLTVNCARVHKIPVQGVSQKEGARA